MLPVTVQETLNKWTSGILTKDEFIREVRWYVHWNFNYGFYEKIFDFAKEHRLPVYALNVPREIITKIRMQGWDTLSDEEKKFIPFPSYPAFCDTPPEPGERSLRGCGGRP